MLRKMYANISNLSIESLELQQDKQQIPTATETIMLNASDFASADNNKLYFNINPLNRQRSIPDVRTRVNPVYINRGYTDEDEITYTLPEGYSADMEPISIHLKKTFGNFIVTAAVNNGKLHYKRHIEITDGTYDKDTYAELVAFYQAVADADSYSVTLVKK